MLTKQTGEDWGRNTTTTTTTTTTRWANKGVNISDWYWFDVKIDTFPVPSLQLPWCIPTAPLTPLWRTADCDLYITLLQCIVGKFQLSLDNVTSHCGDFSVLSRRSCDVGDSCWGLPRLLWSSNWAELWDVRKQNKPDVPNGTKSYQTCKMLKFGNLNYCLVLTLRISSFLFCKTDSILTLDDLRRGCRRLEDSFLSFTTR